MFCQPGRRLIAQLRCNGWAKLSNQLGSTGISTAAGLARGDPQVARVCAAAEGRLALRLQLLASEGPARMQVVPAAWDLWPRGM